MNNNKKLNDIKELENNKITVINNKIIDTNNKINEIENNTIIKCNEIIEIENGTIKNIFNKLDEIENNTIKNYNKINEIENNIIKNSNKINEIENNTIKNSNKINEIENNTIINLFKKIEIINEKIYKLYLLSIQYTTINLTNIKIIPQSSVNSASIFPSGNIITSSFKKFMIYDNNFNIIQINNSAHDDYINQIDIYDENNFVTCSNQTIKTWIKNNNGYERNKVIKNAHNDTINKVIYNLKGNLISCSNDGLIKIWELKNGEYKNIKTLNNTFYVYSILLLEDKNILISAGDGFIIWNLTNNKILFSNDSIDSNCNNGIERLDKDKIIVCHHKSLIFISISELEIIEEFPIDYNCTSIKSIQNKGIFLIGGEIYDEYKSDYNIYVYRSDNYDLIQTINNAHDNYITGFIEINYRLIASYSLDGNITIWSF